MTDKKPIPSLASLRQNASTTNNLAQLKAKMQNKSPSLASLATSSLKKPSTSLQSLATRTTPTSLPVATTTTNNSKKLTSLVSKPPVIKKPSIQPHDIKEEEQDPLLGKPSAVAQFLFKSTAEPRVFDAHSVFQQATQKPSSIKVFQFDQPSPDDIVLAAQSQRGGKHL